MLQLKSGYLILISLIVAVFAQATPAEEKREWAAGSQNLLSDLIKLEKAYIFEPGYGHKDQLNFIHNYRPTMMAELNGNWNLVNRMGIPFQYQPGTYAGEKDSFGLGDILYEGFFSPSGHKSFFWGAGPVAEIPTATDNQLGTRKWSIGPTTAIMLSKGPVTAGLRANHLWSFAGRDKSDDVNRTTIEYRLFYTFGDGWWVGTTPENIANWEAPSNETWTIPVGGGFGKVVGKKQPVNISIEAYSYVEAPDYQADWSCMLRFEFLATANSLFMEPPVAKQAR